MRDLLIATAAIAFSILSVSFLVLAVLFVLCLLVSCSSFIGPTYPYPACLYDSQARYDTGTVLAQRDYDSALLFRFTDSTKGDHGFIWVPSSSSSRYVRRCTQADAISAANATTNH
jgi:hypothetical protein